MKLHNKYTAGLGATAYADEGGKVYIHYTEKSPHFDVDKRWYDTKVHIFITSQDLLAELDAALIEEEREWEEIRKTLK